MELNESELNASYDTDCPMFGTTTVARCKVDTLSGSDEFKIQYGGCPKYLKPSTRPHLGSYVRGRCGKGTGHAAMRERQRQYLISLWPILEKDWVVLSTVEQE